MASLRFRPNGEFTIVQLTDLHIHDQDDTAKQTLALVEDILQAENPDLVVLTGDIIAGARCTDPKQSLRRAVGPMENRSIKWAAVFGNHDDEGIHGRQDLMALQMQLPHCLSEAGPEDVPGVGNYHIAIAASTESEAAAILYFIDSGSYAPAEMGGGYAWIEPRQIDWYRRTATHLGQHGPHSLPALAFFHIPLPEYNVIWDAGQAAGQKFEDVCAPRINSGLFLNLLDIGDVMGIFVGHDHVNDFEGTLGGIRLCYGRAGGYGTYGKDGFLRGARVIRLYEGQRRFDTWLRLADGSVIERGRGGNGRGERARANA